MHPVNSAAIMLVPPVFLSPQRGCRKQPAKVGGRIIANSPGQAGPGEARIDLSESAGAVIVIEQQS
jgi:hypothetical protein